MLAHILTQKCAKGEIDHADLLMSMDEQISRASEEASSRKTIMEKVEKWMLVRDEERWLEEYMRVSKPVDRHDMFWLQLLLHLLIFFH